MKPREQVKQEFVQQWLGKAEDDLQAAQDMLAEGKPYRWIICYHAQQAAEKLLKAYLVSCDIEPPRVHDLTELLRVLSTANPALSEQLHSIASLSIYAVASRYPGDLMMPTREEAEEAVRTAAEVHRLIRVALVGAA